MRCEFYKFPRFVLLLDCASILPSSRKLSLVHCCVLLALGFQLLSLSLSRFTGSVLALVGNGCTFCDYCNRITTIRRSSETFTNCCLFSHLWRLLLQAAAAAAATTTPTEFVSSLHNNCWSTLSSPEAIAWKEQQEDGKSFDLCCCSSERRGRIIIVVIIIIISYCEAIFWNQQQRGSIECTRHRFHQRLAHVVPFLFECTRFGFRACLPHITFLD